MNENPGETPNPLNPNPTNGSGNGSNINTSSNTLDANPSEQMVEETFATETVETSAPARPVGVTTSVDMVAPVETIETTETVDTVETAMPTKSIGATNAATPIGTVETVSSAVATEATETQATPTEVVEPPKKKKTGLIVGIIIVVVALAIGGIVAAVLLMNTQKTDPVAAAMAKLMSGEASSNVAVDGSLDFLSNDANSPITRVGVTLDSKIIMGSNINSSNAVLTLEKANGQKVSAAFDEVYAANGDLYFKVDGLSEVLTEANLAWPVGGNAAGADCKVGDEGCGNATVTDCVEDANGVVNCSTAVTEGSAEAVEGGEAVTTEGTTATDVYSDAFLSVIGTMDGEWVRVSTDQMGMLTDGVAAGSNLSCLTNLVSDINKNSNSTAELYNKYPFVTSSSKNLTVASKANPVYRVNIDSTNFANFVNAMNNSILAGNLYNCLGMNGNVSMAENDAESIIGALPEIYVEVDGNYNFTRLYLVSETEAGGEAVVDLSFSYPTNVSVTEPVEYRNFSDVIQEVMSNMFQIQGTEVTTGVTVTE